MSYKTAFHDLPTQNNEIDVRTEMKNPSICLNSGTYVRKNLKLLVVGSYSVHIPRLYLTYRNKTKGDSEDGDESSFRWPTATTKGVYSFG